MASNRIKGITIEIGGDTSKLDKALKSTDDQLGRTQKSLKDVERLLKMDPGNTELLAQKQRLLADAMAGTAERAKVLKEAAASADAALARQQDFQAKYAPLTKSLAEATSAYEKLKDKKAEMDRAIELGEISTEQYDKWNAKMEESKKTVAGLQKKVTAAKKEMGGPMMDQAQFDALQRELIESKKAAEDAAKSFKEFNATATEISTNADKVAEGASKVADATKGISAAAGAAAGGLVAMAVNAGKAADDLNTLSKQSGFSTEDLQKWQYASDLIDVTVDDIVAAARKMKKNMVSESAETQAAFAQLGVSVYDNSGQIRDATDVFYQLLDGLSRVPNETERDILAMQIFGKSADDLAGIIDDGGKALKQLGQEAKDAGLILSQDALDGANAFNDGLDTLKAKGQAAFMESGASLAKNLLPLLEQAVEATSELLGWFAGLDGETLGLLLKVLLAVAAIAPIASAISAIAGAVSAVSTGIGALTAALGAFNIVGMATSMTLGQWVIIIGLVVAAVVALIAVIAALTGKSKDIKNIDMPEVPDYSSALPTGGRSGGGTSTYSLRTASAADLPHLARGTVTRANSPYLAVVGDNPNEPEVISPMSTIKQAVLEADAESGGRASGDTRVTVNFTGSMAQFVRMLQPEITVETNRRGPEFVRQGG